MEGQKYRNLEIVSAKTNCTFFSARPFLHTCVPAGPAVRCAYFPLHFADDISDVVVVHQTASPRRHLPDSRLTGPRYHHVRAPGQPQRASSSSSSSRTWGPRNTSSWTRSPAASLHSSASSPDAPSEPHPRAPSCRRKRTAEPRPWRPELAISVRCTPNFRCCHHPHRW
jgi:hypothetical protein